MASTTSTVPLTEMRRASQSGDERYSLRDAAANQPQDAVELRPITRQRQILVLISSFLAICITIGLNQSYGVFQSYYISPSQTMLPKTTVNNGALVAFVGTLGSGLTWAGSIVVNPMMTRLGDRASKYICITGVVCMSLGLGLASLCTQVSEKL
jgi:hypothetical protein